MTKIFGCNKIINFGKNNLAMKIWREYTCFGAKARKIHQGLELKKGANLFGGEKFIFQTLNFRNINLRGENGG